MNRAACYLRVSTVEQDLEVQRADVDRVARARGLEPVWFEEVESAGKRRPELERLMREAHEGRFGAVVVWALDRLDRNMHAVVGRVLELERAGVVVVSVRDAWLASAGPARDLLIAVFGWVAEFERTRLRERTVAGLARARAKGTRLGRPPVSPIMLRAAADAVAGGAPVSTAAKAAGVPRASLRRFLASRVA